MRQKISLSLLLSLPEINESDAWDCELRELTNSLNYRRRQMEQLQSKEINVCKME
jgi:hypothetical protein